ncbi:MAG: methylenetetrahydrofolate--tRNA-(uracil(54)-C(5))-methyltransferase (FADH(2)-oxidizing) TrmFO [Coriobacteriales bacterium]|jgi:methylenetetrahydrofolate--tRNA-(uracil-5-)-methyltransferase|nr:methylenetetrahydrofolate--tRNA-(uracil(54)-C(5))-methyltransferase (FADH(2)-oxidizing) TrmFO [Coriobacteriales bacterium]
MSKQVTIIGGGLAGCEAAWQLASRGVAVQLWEMRPTRQTPVHRGGGLAELVCSNSLKSLDPSSAAGALKAELARLGSFLLRCAVQARVPAGGALAVDREAFSELVSAGLTQTGLVELIRAEMDDLHSLLSNGQPAIIATGPMTSDTLASQLAELLGGEHLAFFDAAAPIVEADSLDMDRLFAQSRYDKSGADYLNAPLNREQYERLVQELSQAKRVILRDFETRELFQACQPVEEVARSGADTLRHGALKPVGLTDPHTGQRPWAVVQLRPENRQGSAYNLVGFQTNLSFAEQERVLRLIPGLEQAVFLRYGVMHRNTFIDAPRLLNASLAWRSHPQLHFAGQVIGTEGYTEAIGTGLLAALDTYAQLSGLPAVTLPPQMLLGSLVAYASNPETSNYQPMHVNYGIMQPLDPPIRRKSQRYAAYSSRALEAVERFCTEHDQLDFAPPCALPEPA